jgi:hypothetical protein
MNWRRKRKPFWMKEVFAIIDFIVENIYIYIYTHKYILISNVVYNKKAQGASKYTRKYT